MTIQNIIVDTLAFGIRIVDGARLLVHTLGQYATKARRREVPNIRQRRPITYAGPDGLIKSAQGQGGLCGK